LNVQNPDPLIRKFLSQPYPSEGNKWKLILSISIFISLFMMIFQPFGLSELRHENKLFILGGYGLATFVTLIFNLIFLPLLARNAFRDEKWIVGKELLFLFWVLFTLGLGNLAYSSWTMGFKLTFNNVLFFQFYTLSVGIIPITVLTLVKFNYLNRQNLAEAQQLSTKLTRPGSDTKRLKTVNILSENEKEGVSVPVDEIIFIKSDGNYITVGYQEHGKAATFLLRNTLKYACDLLEDVPFIYQCHRSWLVNLDKISGVNGNSQGFRLIMEGYDEQIPVARNNSRQFRNMILQKNS
jgi:hypothetical protein